MCFAMVEIKSSTYLNNIDSNENNFFIRQMFDYHFSILSKQNKQQARYERIILSLYLYIIV